VHATGIAFARYDAEFRQKHQLYLSILKEFGFGQSLMENRINVEVSEFVHQAKLKNGQPFDPSNMTHLCAINVIISILAGRRYTYGHQSLVHLSECLNNAFRGIVQTLEFFPILQYVPPFRSRLQRFRILADLFLKAAEKEVVTYIFSNKITVFA
jgi:hypothetical protein